MYVGASSFSTWLSAEQVERAANPERNPSVHTHRDLLSAGINAQGRNSSHSPQSAASTSLQSQLAFKLFAKWIKS